MRYCRATKSWLWKSHFLSSNHIAFGVVSWLLWLLDTLPHVSNTVFNISNDNHAVWVYVLIFATTECFEVLCPSPTTPTATNSLLPNERNSFSPGLHHPTTLHQASTDSSMRVGSAISAPKPSPLKQGL